MTRTILHSDLNAFYASVEMMLDPSLRGKAVAVCGSTEERHGIVLAKSELAKKAGIKTGMVNWEARKMCPGLIMVPPQYEEYLKVSQLVRAIYGRYTDQVEPFGMDECWLDVTGSACMGTGEEIAEEIRQSVKEELGLTVSIGVSFNKIFAKLGSDMKKPDAITVITEDNFREKVWPLPASDMIYVGRATTRKLEKYGVYTIGGIAATPPETMRRWFGVNGLALWNFASGQDHSRVMLRDFESPVKSVGHGITCNKDVHTEEEAWLVLLALSQDIGHRLRIHDLAAGGVQLTVKDNDLEYRQCQAQLRLPTQSPLEIAQEARRLLHCNYRWDKPVRALTVRGINLASQKNPLQWDFFNNAARHEKRQTADDTVDMLRSRFGMNCIFPSSLVKHTLTEKSDPHDLVRMPGMMFQ